MPLLPSPINTAINPPRRRRPSKGSMGATLKRSASTPNVRGLTAGETAMSLAEKRRNKLGYHRTSVACVHCRRRKIRCLLAAEDPQNRCSNCIRLKKECNFYPVDQQPSVERRPRSASKAGGRSGENSAASSSSSPGLAMGGTVSSTDRFDHYPTLPMASSQAYHGSVAPLSAGIISPPASIGPGSSRGFEFPPHNDRPSWENRLNDHGPLSSAHAYEEEPMSGHWRESPMTPGYSPFTTAPPPHQFPQHSRDVSGASFPSFVAPRPDSSWGVPTRSMSYGHFEDLSHHYPNGYHQPYQADLRRRASEMHPPPSLQTSANSSNASSGEMHATPISSSIPSQLLHHPHGIPPQWHNVPVQPSMSKIPDYGGWYPDAGQLARVQEEDVPHYGGEPPILYSSAGHR
ncbi:hypothetical protein MMC19_002453 [Ptychographa xylographoides]|nr:hypothetical protein [Ptychographa xylographoides]